MNLFMPRGPRGAHMCAALRETSEDHSADVIELPLPLRQGTHRETQLQPEVNR